MVRSLLLAEKVLIAAYQTDSGKCSTSIEYSLAGTLLMELVLLNKIEISDQRNVTILDSSYSGDPELDWALYRASTAKKSDIRDAVFQLSMSHVKGHPLGQWDVQRNLLERLVGLGILKKENRKIFGLFNSERYPTVNPTPHTHLMEQLRSVYTNPPMRDPRTASILLGLHVRDWLNVLVEKLNHEATTKIDAGTAKAVRKELTDGSEWGTRRQRDQLRILYSESKGMPHRG